MVENNICPGCGTEITRTDIEDGYLNRHCGAPYQCYHDMIEFAECTNEDWEWIIQQTTGRTVRIATITQSRPRNRA